MHLVYNAPPRGEFLYTRCTAVVVAVCLSKMWKTPRCGTLREGEIERLHALEECEMFVKLSNVYLDVDLIRTAQLSSRRLFIHFVCDVSPLVLYDDDDIAIVTKALDARCQD